MRSVISTVVLIAMILLNAFQASATNGSLSGLPVIPPATPGAITGVTPQCPGLGGQTYSIASVPTATSYTWTVPSGWTINIGQGTISITVTTGNFGENGNISVTASNGDGTSAPSTLAVTVNPATPSVPGGISGAVVQCPSLAGEVYSITSVSNATTYTWTVPSGWTITLGQGTLSITVTTGNTGQNGNISVTAGNSCGTSTPKTLAVSVSPAVPSTPGNISGTSSQCPQEAGEIYSINSVNNATGYTWTVPVGWTITGGQNTTSITVTTGNAGQNGNISVTANNSCGSSNQKSKSVTVNADAVIALTSDGSTTSQTLCVNLPITNITYSVTGGGTGAGVTGLPSGVTGVYNANVFTISGTPSATGTYNYTVTTTGTCDQDITAGTIIVTPAAPAMPGFVTGLATQCPQETGENYSINPVSNATGYTWAVPTGWTITGGQNTTGITITTGNAGQNGNITVMASNGCGTSPVRTKAVTVNADAVIALTSANGTNAQTVCVNSAIIPITYSVTGGGSGAGVTGLPTGVTGSFNANVFTISGTPIVAGVHNYTVTTTGTCEQATLSGTITVNPNGIIALVSPLNTVSQTKCLLSPITNIVYQVTGGSSSAAVTGLPAGVNGNFNSGVFTISGVPSVTGTFNYTVTTTGTCVPASTSGSIVVNSLPALPVMIEPDPASACEGATFFAVLQNNDPNVVYSWEANDSNVNLSAGGENNAVAVIDIDNTEGSTTITVTAENNFSCSSEETFTISISSDPAPQSYDVQLYNLGEGTILAVLTNDPSLHFNWGRSPRETWLPEDLGVTTQDYLIGTSYDPDEYYYWIKITDEEGCETISFLEQPVQIAEPIATDNFYFYPNPCNALLNVNLSSVLGAEAIELLDMQGKKIHVWNIKNVTHSVGLNIPDVTAGVYLMRLITGNGKSSHYLLTIDK